MDILKLRSNFGFTDYLSVVEIAPHARWTVVTLADLSLRIKIDTYTRLYVHCKVAHAYQIRILRERGWVYKTKNRQQRHNSITRRNSEARKIRKEKSGRSLVRKP
jgi:hypothetical protein